jgi:ubiquitin carboxyl-terminal hydrolase L5
LKRTYDYEPFFKEFFSRLHHTGYLNPLLGLDEEGKVVKAAGSTSTAKKTTTANEKRKRKI